MCADVPFRNYSLTLQGRLAMGQFTMIKFWWQSGSWIRIRIRFVTMVRCALVEVCTVSVLLVHFKIHSNVEM